MGQFFKTIVFKKVNALINIFLQKKSQLWNRKFLFLLAVFGTVFGRGFVFFLARSE